MAKVSTQERRRSALLHAVAKQAGKFAVREHLSVGAYAVKARISGTVDGQKVESMALEGTVAVEADGERASFEAAEPGRLIAYLLTLVPTKKAEALRRELPSSWRKTLAGVPDGDVAVAEALLKQLRFEGPPKPVKGAVKLLKTAG